MEKGWQRGNHFHVVLTISEGGKTMNFIIKQKIKNEIENRCIHSVSLSNGGFLIKEALVTVFKNVLEEFYEVPMKECLAFSPTTYNVSKVPKDFIFYKGVPIWIDTIYVTTDGKKNDDRNMTLNTINTKYAIKVLHEFITRLYRLDLKLAVKRNSDTTYFFGGRKSVQGIKYRTFDDIFVAADIKRNLIMSIDKFMSREDWYAKNRISYHYGILLYGPPGTGKSVLAQAIAKHIQAYTCVLNGDAIFDLPSMLSDLPSYGKRSGTRVVICEDIDCGLKNRYCEPFGYRNTINSNEDDDETDDDFKASRDRISESLANSRRKGFSSLLNAMDGLAAPEHVVYIFTTNDMDVIDPALLRPGRLDLKLEITFVNRKQFDEFTLRHYGKVSDLDFSIKDGMTFAAIQNEVMKEASFEEIIDFVKK